MEQGGGGEGAAAGEEDRLSALLDDVLVLILLKLATRTAARTSVLSRRWRRVWGLLPELTFFGTEPHWLRDALDAHNVLLSDLIGGTHLATFESPAVWLPAATPESLAVWLPAAARRVSAHLFLETYGRPEEPKDYDSKEEEEAAAAQRGALEFPCFDKATKICFVLGYHGLAVPVTGVFARLTELKLKRVWFHGPGELGDAVSSPRCPCLRLTVEDARGLRDLAINSESMLWMKLVNLRTLSQLIVVAPGLKELTMESCFVKSPPVADISAPLLTRLDWIDQYDPSSVHLGNIEHLQWLGTLHFLVYGSGDFLHNQSCFSLLQHFEAINNLILTLEYSQDIEDYDYMMEDMAVLPDITFLCLRVLTNGHTFGASALHVLRLCTGIRRLKLELVSEAEAVCSSDCICVELVVGNRGTHVEAP